MPFAQQGCVMAAVAAPIDIAAWRPRHNPWLIALTVTLATFMEVLDTSIANVALPHIAGSFGASSDESTWVLTSYLVSNAIVLPISAWLATRSAANAFTCPAWRFSPAAAFMCGLAPSLGMLDFLPRPAGRGRRRIAAQRAGHPGGHFSSVEARHGFRDVRHGGGSGASDRPYLGGWITDNYSWRWIFYINVPISLFSLYLTHSWWKIRLTSKRAEERRKNVSIDYIGLGLIALGVGCLQMVLDKGQELGLVRVALDCHGTTGSDHHFRHLVLLGMAPSSSDR